jgi:hypothetical protein
MMGRIGMIDVTAVARSLTIAVLYPALKEDGTARARPVQPPQTR